MILGDLAQSEIDWCLNHASSKELLAYGKAFKEKNLNACSEILTVITLRIIGQKGDKKCSAHLVEQ